MKYDLKKLKEDAEREYWENAYKNKLKDIFHMEVAQQWLLSPEGKQMTGLDKAESGALNAMKNLKELKAEIKFLEELMGK